MSFMGRFVTYGNYMCDFVIKLLDKEVWVVYNIYIKTNNILCKAGKEGGRV